MTASNYLPPLPFRDRINPQLLTGRWPAAWCRHPDLELTRAIGVYLFRKTFTLDAVPAEYLVHVSADSRYRLFINGQPVGWGPARSDAQHWRFDTLDLAPHLQAGENVIAAEVTFLGELAPMAQLWCQHGLIVQGNTDAEAAVNTPKGWSVWKHDGYEFSNADTEALKTYCVIGPSEILDLSKHPWGWQNTGFNDSRWVDVKLVGRDYGVPFGLIDGEANWWLLPRSFPMMEETPQRLATVRRAEGATAPEGFLAGKVPLNIPANTKAVFIIDNSFETTAWPEITVSGGKGTRLRLAYAEALFDADGRKGNRDEVEGRQFRGYGDTWHLDGGDHRLLRPTWWRTYRYAELTIETKDQPVTVENLIGQYTGYPFKVVGGFRSPQMEDAEVLQEIGWRTLRLCAHETFMDCPYYEQMQYVGDTRIQCLISLYVSGDARLYRNAIEQINFSRISEGLTQSRYPTRMRQIIPPFSLWYIGIINDYFKHVPDDNEFLRGLLPSVQGILEYFRPLVREDGLLGIVPFWNFVDWCPEWNFGRSPGTEEGGSAILALQYALALKDAAEIEAALGNPAVADTYTRLHMDVVAAVERHCYVPEQHRVADTPEKKTFSQHATILFLLANDRLTPGQMREMGERLLNDPTLTQTTVYFRFYLTRALVKAGLGDRFLETLKLWRDMKDVGLTTWAEQPEPTRSDCHAWSASPNYELLATVLGVNPAAPGFAKVRITPHLGHLTEASGTVPHPRGNITVKLKRNGDKLDADIQLPDGVSGELHWNGVVTPLSK